MNPYTQIDASTEREGRALAEAWSRAEFEAVLPLYAGGDLELREAAAVHAYVDAHPERSADVEAAVAARRLIVRGEVPGDPLGQSLGRDLWPGIRAALHTEGWIGAGAPVGARAAEAARVEPGAAVSFAPSPPKPPVRRRRPTLVTSGFAAAAAVAVTAGLAWVLGFEGLDGSSGLSVTPAVAVTTDLGGRTPTMAPALGTAPRVTYTANQELPQGVIRLGAPAGRPLEEGAIDLGLGHFHPDAALPLTGGGGAALVGGVPTVREVLLVPQQRR